jgi:nucleoside-diphosphate-sugar epimerase
MEVVGRGMLARSLAPHVERAPDALAFASGVADSRDTSPASFRREEALLQDALERCARDGLRLLYFSSAGEVYGPGDAERDESSPPAPATPYGHHKLRCEERVRAASAGNLVLRLPNVVGPGANPHQLIPSLVRQAREGAATLLRGAARDLLGAEDFARIALDLAEGGHAGTFNVASGHAVPVTAIFDEVQAALGTKASVRLLPGGHAQRFGIAKLRSAMRVDFPEDYYLTVLRAYVRRL